MEAAALVAPRPVGPTLAIMQPYLFPYIGYFQLMAAVDRFVLYDDVNYIKQGWVNRNRILVGGVAHMFTMPLADAGPNKLINELVLHERVYPGWREKFLRTLAQSYAKAPHVERTVELVASVLPAMAEPLIDVLHRSLSTVAAEIGISTGLVRSSSAYGNAALRSVERILDICAREGAVHYINAIGGRALYTEEDFNAKGIRLSFLRSRLPAYPQGAAINWEPGLSILDMLMFVPSASVQAALREFDLE